MPNIKDLFKKHDSSGKVLSSKSVNDLTSSGDAESSGYIQGYIKEKDRFTPAIDFEKPKTFVRYGSAEKYYENAIQAVYRTYPYDGSHKEKVEWHNSASYFDNYVFEKLYPRTNGYVNFGGMDAPTVWSLTLSNEIIRKGTGGQYIYVKGGPNKAGVADSLDQSDPQKFSKPASKSSYLYTSANIYDAEKKRASNFAMNGADGNTVEMWVKRRSAGGGAPTFSTPFIDLWNGIDDTLTAIRSGSYGRFLVETRINTSTGLPFDGANFHVTYMSGTAGAERVPILLGTSYSIPNDVWHHVAVSIKNSGSNLNIKTYLNGQLADNILTGSTVQEVTGALNANLAAYKHYPTNKIKNAALAAGITSTAWDGGGSSTGSLDEFRYWKAARSSQEIGRSWFTQVHGGTNFDDSNTDLGVYFKFNEGITGKDSFDSVVLDYSGRISNGQIQNYTSTVRSTGSAIVETTASVTEFRDPIIYSFHPDVKALLSDKKQEGSVYDATNTSAIHTTLPTWMAENDNETGGSNLVKIIQIMASYLDTLQLQLEFLPRIKDSEYTKYTHLKASNYADAGNILSAGVDSYPSYSSSFDGKPKPFIKNAIQSLGIDIPEIFTDADALEELSSRDEDRVYKERLYNVKNQIYQNIYNNLSFILKSKGTEKSFRNLVRCFGVDDDLVRLNLYGNNVDYELKNNFRSTAVKRTYVDFMDVDRQGATIYMMTSSINNNTNAYSYIPSNLALVSGGFGMTFQTEVYFPNKGEEGDTFYQPFTQLTSSLYGMHTAVEAAAGTAGQGSTTWNSPDVSEFKVYAVRPESKSPHAYFQLTSSILGINLTSSVFDYVYDNEKWNFAVRIKPTKYPWANSLTGTNSASLASGVPADQDLSYEVSFYGAHADLDLIVDEFDLSATISAPLGDNFMSGSKRLYLGAHRTNFTGGLLQESDVRISSTRAWMDYLTNEEIRAQAKDANSKGVLHPYRNAFTFQTAVQPYDIPRSDLLIFEWDYTNVTGSDAGISGIPTVYDARFIVEDISSGSSTQNFADWITDDRYAGLNFVTNQYTGRGDFFEPNNEKVVDHTYLHSAKLDSPEVINSSDMIEILNQDDLEFTRESRPIDYFYAVEKSMYQTISDEILRMFATIADFNNLIGEPVNRYRGHYKDMDKLKSLFFESIGNSPDLDKYVDFYKWIDAAITKFLEQLFPASANYGDELRTVVESHVLERNAYRNKFPTLEVKQEDPEVPVLGINELKYNWKFGHAPKEIEALAAAGTVQIVGTPPDEGSVVSITSTAGTAKTYVFMEDGVDSTGTIDGGSVVVQLDGVSGVGNIAAELQTAINHTNGHNGGSANSVINISRTDGILTLTQVVKGTDGNQTITYTGGTASHVLVQGFTGGQDTKENKNCLWYNQRAERTIPALSSSVASVNTDRQTLLDIATTDNTGSYLSRYQGSTYVLRKLSKPYKEGVSFVKNLHGGTNFSPNKKKNFWKDLLKKNSNNGLFVTGSSVIIDDPKEDRNCTDTDDSQIKYKAKSIVRLDDDNDGSTFTTSIYNEYRGNLLLPFNIYSTASLDPVGIGTYPLNSFESLSPSQAKVTITNMHDDSYGTLNEVPMQGPFPQKYEGGNQHRHFRLNNGTDTMVNRPEAFRLNPVGIGGMSVIAPGNAIIASYQRDFVAKRPVVIKNILQTTASVDVRLDGAITHGPIGNYSAQHNIVQTSGRKTNNKYFVEQEGVGFGHVITGLEASPEISSVMNKFYDFEIRNRKTTDAVFVERFSAPGSYEAMSRGYLGPFAEEMSVYNAMPFRNLSVRGFGAHKKQVQTLGVEISASIWSTSSLGLNSLLSRHTLFGGYDHEESTVPAFHKTYRNRLRRIEKLNPYDNSTSALPTTGSVFDNAFVTHMIPRSDFQYSWITSSILSTDMSTAFGFGYFPYSGEVSSSAGGFASAVNFVSASEHKSYFISSLGKRYFGITDAGIAAEANFSQGIPTDFVGLNTNFADSLDTAGNIVTTELNPHIAYTGQTSGGRRGLPASLNAINLHRGGAYGYSTFKQIRNMYHPIARYLKDTNTFSISVQDFPKADTSFQLTVFPRINYSKGPSSQFVTYEQMKGLPHVKSFSTKRVENYIEPALSSKFMPLRHKVNVITAENKIAPLTIDHSYTNNYDYFANPDLMNRMNYAGVIEQPGRQVYDNLLEYTVKGHNGESAIPPEANPIKGFRHLIYKETIYPKEAHTYLAKSRGRTSYDEDPNTYSSVSDTPIATTAFLGQQRTFWKDTLAKRQRPANYGNALGSVQLGPTSFLAADPIFSLFPLASALSVWPLDTGTRMANLVGSPFSVINMHSGSDNGQLSINDNQLYFSNAQPQAGYEYHNITPTTASSVGIMSDWIPNWSTANYSGKTPWFGSYDEYASDVRVFGQDYTVVPEFRISQHMDYILENEDSSVINNFLSIEGGYVDGSAASETGSYNEDFFDIYSHSDFLKHFDVIHQQHDGFAKQTKITVKCHAIKKMLPYQGFYPVTRAVQMGTYFSASFGPYLERSGALSQTRLPLQSFLQPLMNPGILYNTVKSGIAVDWLAFTASAVNIVETATQGFNVVTHDSNLRLPFETLINPEKYLPVAEGTSSLAGTNKIHYIDTYSPWLGSVTNANNHGVWTGKNKPNYSLAMNNFMAEIPNFFLNNGILSRMESSTEASFISGTVYYMDLDLYKSPDTVMYEGPSRLPVTGAASAPYENFSTFKNTSYTSVGHGQARGIHYGPCMRVSGSGITGPNTTLARYDPAFAAWTPPYFYGKATARFRFAPHEFTDLLQGESIQVGESEGAFDMSEIVAHIATAPSGVVYFNDYSLDESGVLKYGLTDSALLTAQDNTKAGAHATKHQMQIPSSMNIFGLISRPDLIKNAQGEVIQTDVQTEKTRWVIAPKFECPTLNFANNSSAIADNGLGIFSDGSSVKGMWRGYANKQFGGQGIYYNLKDSFTSAQSPFTVAGNPVAGIAGQTAAIGSLREKLFANRAPTRLGAVREEKEISEAIVAVPFTMNGDKKIFFPFVPSKDAIVAKAMGRKVVNSLLGKGSPLNPKVFVPGQSLIDQVEKMQKYVFPPTLDFINKENLAPFQMYIFEFTHTLDKEDLLDIWQGVMPKIARTAEKQSTSVTHFLTNNEILLGKDITKEIRWMVFKVKQRASYNFSEMRRKSAYGSTYQLSQEPEQFIIEGLDTGTGPYSYNWPYDFFSLVELAKIDTGVQIGGEVPITPADIATEPVDQTQRKSPASGGPPLQVGSEYTPADNNPVQTGGEASEPDIEQLANTIGGDPII